MEDIRVMKEKILQLQYKVHILEKKVAELCGEEEE